MHVRWHTRWQGQEIVVRRDDVEVDRFDAHAIERVTLLYRGVGALPGDIVQAVVELPDECLVFGAETGFAGRVNFERQVFWAERACVHWLSRVRAPLPLGLRTSFAFVRLSPPAYARLPKAQLAPYLARWPVQRPQTWDQRKRWRIMQLQPFSTEAA